MAAFSVEDFTGRVEIVPDFQVGSLTVLMDANAPMMPTAEMAAGTERNTGH